MIRAFFEVETIYTNSRKNLHTVKKLKIPRFT